MSMSPGTERVAVNGTEIPSASIDGEIQNHRAASADEARTDATRALVIRELLLQEAARLNLSAPAQSDQKDRRETDDEALIGRLLEESISSSKADEAGCRKYYHDHPDRFRSPDLFEPAHILLSAAPSDTEAYEAAVTRAETIIATVTAQPEKFGPIAREQSDCSSAKDGGALGQVTSGQTAPEFETFLFALEEGQICSVPIKSRYGVHVLRLDRRIDGRKLPFDAVHDKIAAYLEETLWRRGIHEFINDLADRADIEGISIP